MRSLFLWIITAFKLRDSVILLILSFFEFMVFLYFLPLISPLISPPKSQVYSRAENWNIIEHFVHHHAFDKFTLLLDGDFDEETNLMAVHRTINLFNRFCSLFLPTLLHRKTPLKSLGILAQSPSDVLSLSAEHWNGMIQNENLSKLYNESNGNGINVSLALR